MKYENILDTGRIKMFSHKIKIFVPKYACDLHVTLLIFIMGEKRQEKGQDAGSKIFSKFYSTHLHLHE